MGSDPRQSAAVNVGERMYFKSHYTKTGGDWKS